MRRLLRLLWYARPYWAQLIASVLLMSLVGACEAFRMMLIGPILKRVLDPSTGSEAVLLCHIPVCNIDLYLQNFVPSLLHGVLAMVVYALVMSTFLKGVCDYTGTYLVNYGGYGLITDMRNDLYSSLLKRSAAFFQKHSTGTLVSAIINDMDKVQNAMSAILAEFLQQFFTLIFLTCAAIALGGRLAWVLVAFIPVVLLSARKIGRRVRTTTRTGQDKLAEIQNLLQETITGNRIVKAFSMELFELVRFRGAAKRLFRANMRSVLAQAVSSPLMDCMAAVAISFLLYIGRLEVKAGRMDGAQFLTFIAVVFGLYNPIRKFAVFYNSFQQALGASESIFKFMDVKDAVLERPHAVALPPLSQSIRLEDVRFRYHNDEREQREVLCGVNLTIERGEVVAIVGSSGSGKSTLVNLIPRFFDVTGGRVLIDGRDVREATLASLRGQIGIVTQETILFNDTVRNNIAYGQPQISQGKVEAAARAALAHDFIMAMPSGYDTVIGEKGFRLSGGERQRLSIARAILKNSPILILDEATSALDNESEAHVSAALQNLMQNRTVLVIAHRLSTVRRANRIVVLEDGQIAESGGHEELLARGGAYRRLYDSQFEDSGVLHVRPRRKGMA